MFAKFGWKTQKFCHKKIEKAIAKLESDRLYRISICIYMYHKKRKLCNVTGNHHIALFCGGGGSHLNQTGAFLFGYDTTLISSAHQQQDYGK